MANKRSAMKAHRASERKRIRNRTVRSALRTYVKKARVGIAGTDAELATATVAEAAKFLDSAANKGVIHKNQAARRKSRLMRQLAARERVLAAGEVAATPTTTRTRATGTAARATGTAARATGTAARATGTRTTRRS